MKYLDIVKIKTGQLAVVSQVSHCLHTDDKDHPSCSLTPLDKNNWSGKEAWFYDEEIEVVANVIDLMGHLNLTGTTRTCAGGCGRLALHGSNFCAYYFGVAEWGCVPSVGTAGECICTHRTLPDPDCPVHGLPKVTPDLPLNAKVAKANGKDVKYLEGVGLGKDGWYYWNPRAHDGARWLLIPDYPNDLVAARDAFDRYFELQCRKIDDRFDYWIERFYRDGWKWRVRLGFADKSVVADSLEEGFCLAIVAHAEGK